LTGRSASEVRGALEEADGSVKLAVLLLHGCGLKEATDALERAGGRLRTALASIDPRANSIKS
jgi:N-acetylmuramic acid 6-phosphate etherase